LSHGQVIYDFSLVYEPSRWETV